MPRVMATFAGLALVAGLSSGAAAQAVSGPGREPPRCAVVPRPAGAGIMSHAAPARRTLYLNRHGGRFTPGEMDSSRDLIDYLPGPFSIPAFTWGEAAWDELVECVQLGFQPYNLEVTDADPGDALHIEIVIGGDPTQAGLPCSTGGVAPFDETCGPIENAIGFVFSESYTQQTVQELCWVTMHEAGHALGLDHAYFCKDSMSYLLGCLPKAFQRLDVPCGEDEEKPSCECGPTQNSVEHLLAVLGPSPTDPPVDPGDPEDPDDPSGCGAGQGARLGEACGDHGDCGGGLCVQDGEARTCAMRCDPAAPSSVCSAGLTCQALDDGCGVCGRGGGAGRSGGCQGAGGGGSLAALLLLGGLLAVRRLAGATRAR